MRDTAETYAPRRRRWPLIATAVVVVALAAGWTGFWYFAAGKAETALANWRASEARQGRVHACGQQAIAGFPFRIEVRCSEPTTELRGAQPANFKARDAVAAVQIYEPNLMIGEVTGPLTITQPGVAGIFTLNWTLAQTSVRGLMPPPERISLVLDKLKVDFQDTGPTQPVGTAEHMEIHLRQPPRLPQDEPALDLALRLTGGLVPPVPQLATTPVEADIAATLRGLSDLSPKPLTQRLRELQAANGRLEIKQARVRQGEILAVGQGTLRLTAGGKLDGDLNLTVAGLEHLVTALGLDQAVGRQAQSAATRLAPGLNLEKLLGPRGNAAIAAAGVAMLGKPAELEGRKAVMLPLRFADGMAFLGPLPIGQMKPLF